MNSVTLFKINKLMSSKKLLILPVLLLLFNCSFSQVRLVIEDLPVGLKSSENLFFSSNLNSWNPADSSYSFKKNLDGNYELLIDTDELNFRYKITRGSWTKVECDSLGNDIDNRFIDDSLAVKYIRISAWKDSFAKKNGSVSDNVHLIDSTFVIPTLNRERKVWVYLPKSYSSSNKNYPVIYMHDAQNLFDSNTSYAGEWKIDETLDIANSKGGREAIIVGIENGGKYRIDELTPFANKEYGGGNAKYYMEFIVDVVKNYVDVTYRTKSDRENTFMLGSSLGGLVSFYGLMKYKNVFSKSVVMSPSFWFSDRIYYIPSSSRNKKINIFFLAGDSESPSMIPNIEKMMGRLEKYNYPSEDIVFKAIKGGEHNEKLWGDNFLEAYNWLLN